jgi:hypothetical protein
MPPTITLILKSQQALDLALETFKALGDCAVEPNDSFCILDTGSESWARAWLDRSITEIYEVDAPHILELGRFFLAVEWRDRPRDFANELIVRLDGLMTGFVDNDHGLVVTLGEMRGLIKGKVDWRYLKEMPAFE